MAGAFNGIIEGSVAELLAHPPWDPPYVPPKLSRSEAKLKGISEAMGGCLDAIDDLERETGLTRQTLSEAYGTSYDAVLDYLAHAPCTVADGATTGHPQACPEPDQWHLVIELAQALQVLEAYEKLIKQGERTVRALRAMYVNAPAYRVTPS